MHGIIDIHTHAFPDGVAARAMEVLLAETDEVTAHLDGRLSSLLASMERAGVVRSVLCSIATRPSQFEAILSWSAEIRSERIDPFPSVHPADPAMVSRIREIGRSGFRGVKMHPYYQDFSIDEERMFPAYEALREENLLLLLHTGFDVAFPHVRRADPRQIIAVQERFPGLKLIATHLGAWQLWDEVEQLLVGREIYMEISYALPYLSREKARSIILRHPADFVLFGSDSPWEDQSAAVTRLKGLDLGSELEDRIFRQNALRILSGAGRPTPGGRGI